MLGLMLNHVCKMGPKRLMYKIHHAVQSRYLVVTFLRETREDNHIARPWGRDMWRLWVPIAWLKYCICVCCVVCNIEPYWTALYRVSIEYGKWQVSVMSFFLIYHTIILVQHIWHAFRVLHFCLNITTMVIILIAVTSSQSPLKIHCSELLGWT